MLKARLSSFVAGLTGLSVLVLTPPASAAKNASGNVYIDANGNGRRDNGEVGLAGVPITDGVGFTNTTSDGSFTLTLSPDPVKLNGEAPVVSVSFPSGYWPTAGWFRRLDPKAETMTVEPFGLQPRKQRRPFLFVHGTDCHVPRGGPEKFIGFRRDMEALKDRVDFCIITGDLVDLSDAHSLEQAKAEFDFWTEHTRDFPVPLFAVPGNHDISGVRAKSTWPAERTGYVFYTERVGPLRWSFNAAGIHFAGLDFNHQEDGKWVWGVPSSALDWLDKDLALAPKDARVFLFIHHPGSTDALTKWLAKHPVERVFYGHGHTDAAHTCSGVPTLEGASLSQVFHDNDRQTGYRLVRVTDDGIETCYRETGNAHAVTLNAPRDWDVIRDPFRVRGTFYDAAGDVKSATLVLAGLRIPLSFAGTGLWRTFDQAIPLGTVPSGTQPLRIELTDGTSTWPYEHNYLFATTNVEPVSVDGPASLELDVTGVDDAGGRILFNGQELGALSPTTVKGNGPFPTPVKGIETQSFTVPAGTLLNLNHIDLKSAANGHAVDTFCLLDVRLRTNKKTTRDAHAPFGARHPAYVSGHAERWIELR